jgi:hypothetical protein
MTSVNRYTAQNPCPICKGHPALPQGQGIRCTGFISQDGRWARCSREQYADSLALDERTTPPSYLHRLTGLCACGVRHGK